MNNQDEHRYEYFLNRNILKSGITTEDGEYSRTGKALWILAPLILFTIAIAFVAMMTHSFFAAIPITIVCVIIYIYIIRKMVLDENQFKKLVANNELNKEMSLANFSNILNISSDDDGSNARIYFQTNKKGLGTAYIVTFDYASIIDETDNANENVLDAGYIEFFRQLNDYGFSVNTYDISIKNQISPGTLDMIRRAKYLTEGSWLQLVAMLQNETISNLEQNGSSKYRIYFEIINTDYRYALNFKDIVEESIKRSLSTQTSITNPHIINDEEMINFMVNYFNIDSFSTTNFDRNVRTMSADKYLDFISFYDINGIEYAIDDFDPQFSSRSGRVNFDDDKQLNTIARNAAQNKKNEEMKANKKAKQEEQRQKNMLEKQARFAEQKAPIKKPRSSLQQTKAEINQKLYEEKKAKQEMQQRQAKRSSAGNLTLADLLNNSNTDDKR